MGSSNLQALACRSVCTISYTIVIQDQPADNGQTAGLWFVVLGCGSWLIAPANNQHMHRFVKLERGVNNTILQALPNSMLNLNFHFQ